MICSHCGRECGADVFCTQCGNRLVQPNTVPYQQAPYMPKDYAAYPYAAYPPVQPVVQEKKMFPYWAVLLGALFAVSLVFGLAAEDYTAFFLMGGLIGIPLFLFPIILLAILKKKVLAYALCLLGMLVLFVIGVFLVSGEEEVPEEDLLPPPAAYSCLMPQTK